MSKTNKGFTTFVFFYKGQVIVFRDLGGKIIEILNCKTKESGNIEIGVHFHNCIEAMEYIESIIRVVTLLTSSSEHELRKCAKTTDEYLLATKMRATLEKVMPDADLEEVADYMGDMAETLTLNKMWNNPL